MSYKLFLDDVRRPEDVTWGDFKEKFGLLDNVVIVRNYNEFIRAILNAGLPEIISFDHDLCSNHYKACVENKMHDVTLFTEPTGLSCAEFLFEFCLNKRIPLPKWHIHSQNPVGGQIIKDLLMSYDATFRSFYA